MVRPARRLRRDLHNVAHSFPTRRSSDLSAAIAYLAALAPAGQAATVCNEAEVPHPNIISESGRAMVAYHSALIFGVLGVSGLGAGLRSLFGR